MNDDEKQQLLIRLTTGEIGPDDPELRAVAAGDDEFADSVAELLAVRERLDAAARAEGSLLEPRPELVAGMRPDLVATTLRKLAAGGPIRPPSTATASTSRWKWVRRVLAAAAVVVLALWLRGRFATHGEDDERTIGGERLRLHAPEWSPTSGLQLSWECREPMASFRVEIYDPASPARPLLELPHTTETEWRIAPEMLQQVRPGHRWRVIASSRGRELEREGVLVR